MPRPSPVARARAIAQARAHQVSRSLRTSSDRDKASTLHGLSAPGLLRHDEGSRGGMRSEVQVFSSQGRMFNVHGTLNGLQVEANADTGASFNVISKALAAALGLTPEPGTERNIVLPSNRTIFSPGEVKGSFKFGGENMAHGLSCHILDHSSYPLVLGSRFLRLTETFSKHMRRLNRVFSLGSRVSLNYYGGQQDVVPGSLNGFDCFAVPDSGSDIMAVSGAFAKAHGMKVRREMHYRHNVEFIDGSTKLTDGLVEDLTWQFAKGEAPVRCDFHVIENLPVDAILNNAYIDEYDVFSKYDELFMQIDLDEDKSAIYNIRLARKCRAELARLEDSFVQDMTSDTPFSPEIVERERARRDEIRDRIAGLLEDERGDQREHERKRQARFDEEWKKHREIARRLGHRSNNEPSSSSSQSHTAGNTLPLPGAIGSSARSGATLPQSDNRRKGWSKWMKWK